MMELPDKSRPTTRPKKEAVIPKGSAAPVSRPAGRRFLDYVFAESPKAIVANVVQQTLVPRLKSAGEEAFGSFLHGILWGGGASPSGMMQRGTIIRGGGVVLNGGVDYNALSNPMVQAAVASGAPTGPYQDLKVTSRELAEHLLASLIADLNEYRVVSAADLYEAAQLTPPEGSGSIGWYGLDGARIVQERDGFKLMLPKPVRI